MENQDKSPLKKESLLTRSLRANGYLFPITPEQVEFLEQEHKELFEQVPTGLTSGNDILSRGIISFKPSHRDMVEPHIEHSLAQAAREGKIIPEHIRAQMQKDRLNNTQSKENSDTPS
jgi:hypothetical protein